MKKLIILTVTSVLLSACNIYKKYERPQVDTQDLYRTENQTKQTADSSNLGQIPWQEMFTDSYLQSLIQQGLNKNADLQIAMKRMDQAKASLMAANWAYTPQIALAPNGALSNFNGTDSKTYAVPLTASWQVPLFGGLLNSKRAAKVGVEQNLAYKQAVQTQLIASIATQYYTLIKLDKELEIMEETITTWGESIETMRGLKAIGITNEAAIAQSEANYSAVKLSKLALMEQIKEVENALSITIGQVPQRIARGKWEDVNLPSEISTGVPLDLLANRPDVKQAEMSLASAYYATNVARSAFYPNVSISGTLSWTNNAGSMIVDPAEFLKSVAGSLTLPLLSQGSLKANLRINKAEHEIALTTFNQTLLNAGAEVSNALSQYQTATAKETERSIQIEKLEYSVKYTQELFKLSSSTYLEVLTAQQGLLSAQLSETDDYFEKISSIIQLYQALGGGVD